ncbi:MAG: type I-E CRISPR-associated protein Cas6/Cse3/CasE [Candidatus Wallbacteria bacterium]|nr:type I-E CRISPR-associated protein Cas6/Cse3/CasE [Candidatus Wallbacteria bacterium]
MSFLSRITVNSQVAAKLGLHNSYEWHRRLWKAFPGREEDERDFLFRVDEKNGEFRVYLLSPIKPAIPDWGEWETKAISSTFLQHKEYIFSLRANPTVKRVVRDSNGLRKKNGRRAAITSPEELTAWIKQKASEAGCELNELELNPPLEQRFYRKGSSGKHISIDFQGKLKVKDQKAFVNAYDKGIGPAKGFGFGLLLLKPISK